MSQPYTNSAGLVFPYQGSGTPLATREYADNSSADAATAMVTAFSQYANLGGPTAMYVQFFMSGNVSTGTNKYRFVYVGMGANIVGVVASVGTAPATSSILLDVNVDGTTIFTTQSNRLTIAAAATTGSSGTIEVPAVSSMQTISFDLDQVGTGTTGANMAVTMLLNPWPAF